MTKDRVHPLKLEDPASGGVETDEFPNSLDKNEDFVDARGVTFQNTTSNDEAVVAERDAEDNLVLTDPVAGTYTLSELVSGGFDINDAIFDIAGGFVYDSNEQIVMRS